MFEFRVTKYDPTYRDANGAYIWDEWTSVSDIGRVFGGVILTESEYQRVEDTYAGAAVAFLEEAGVTHLTVTDLENHLAIPLPFTEASSLRLANVGAVVQRMLREEFWCRLEGEDAFIHVGYDYYMNVGVPRPCPVAESLARQHGLFVEPFRSPYNERGPA
jgi:hypothetical protein